MTFTLEKLKEARDKGIPDEIIWQTAVEADQRFSTLKEKNVPLETAFQAYQESQAQSANQPPQEFFSFEDAVSAIGTIPEALAVGLPAAYQKLVTGLEIPEKSKAIESELAFQERMQRDQEDRVAAGKATVVGSAIRGASPSVSGTVATIPAAILGGMAGTAVGGPAAWATGPAGAMAASGTVAYRMAGSDMMYRAYKQLEEKKGSPLTDDEKAEFYKIILPIAQNYALWEAGPEAVSNAITVGVGKFVFNFGKGAAKTIVQESIDAANKTLTRKIAEKGAAVTGGLGSEIASEAVTAVGQYPEEAKIRQLEATGEVSRGEPPTYPGGYLQAAKDVAPATIALYGMMGTAAGGAKALSLPFRREKSPEQIEEDNINLEADRMSRDLSIGDTDEETKGISAALNTARDNLAAKKEVYTALETSDPAAQSLGLEIREMEREVAMLDTELRKRTGEPIATAEARQAELARGLAAQPKTEEEQRARYDELKRKAEGQVESERTLPDGTKVMVPATEGQFLSVEEGKEYRQLRQKFEPVKQPAEAPVTEAAPPVTPAPVEEVSATITPEERAAEVADEKQIPSGTIENQPFQVSVPDASGKIARLVTVEIPMEWDAEIGEWLMTEEGNRIANETKAQETEIQKQIPAKTYAQLENEALDIQNKINQEGGVYALIGVSDDKLTISGLESREKGKGTRALEIITSAADQNGTTISLKAEPKGGDVTRLKNLYSKFGFVNDPDFAPESNRMIRYPAAPAEELSATITESAPATEGQPALTPQGRRMMTEKVPPVPAEERIGQVEIDTQSQKFFGNKRPERFTVVDNDTDKLFEFKAAYFPATGDLVVNNAFIRKGENINDIIAHELGHYIFGDTKVKEAFDNFYNALSPEAKAQIDEIVATSYNKETGESQIEEKQVQAFAALAKTPDTRNLFQILVDALKNFWNRVTGSNIKFATPERTALAMLSTARRRFRKGERIERAETKEKRMQAQTRDARFAELEQRAKEGDKEAEAEAQGMVDEAAKDAGYNVGPVWHGTNAKNLTSFDLGHFGKEHGDGMLGIGFYVTKWKDSAKGYGPNLIKLFVKTNNPLIVTNSEEFNSLRKRFGLNSNQYNEITQKAIEAGYDSIMYTLAGDIMEMNVFSNSNLKSAEPFTYDDAGNLIPLSERFRPTSPDIRRMAAEPRRGKIAGAEIAAVKTTPIGINRRTEDVIRRDVFNSDTVSPEQTSKAYDLIDRLSRDQQEANVFAEEINELTRKELSEQEKREVDQTIGAVKLGNELFKYAVNLAAKGDIRMLQLLTERLNTLATGFGSVEINARNTQARQNLSSWVKTASETQKTGIVNAVAIQIYGPNATQEQIDLIRDAINAVNKTKVEDADAIYTDLEETGSRTGVEIRKAVEKAMDKAESASKDPWVMALEIVKAIEGFQKFTYEGLTISVPQNIKNLLQKNLANFSKKMKTKGADGLEKTFWKTMSDQENKLGPLGEVDMAVNRNLASIVKDTLVRLGLKGEVDSTKMTLIEQVANILTNNELSADRMKEADARISAEIEARRGAEITEATDNNESEDTIDAIEAKWVGIKQAWDEAMSRQMDIPVSDATLRRLISNEIKEADTNLRDITKLTEGDPAVAERRKNQLVESIVEKLYKARTKLTERQQAEVDEITEIDNGIATIKEDITNLEKRIEEQKGIGNDTKALQRGISDKNAELKRAEKRKEDALKRAEPAARDYSQLSMMLKATLDQMISGQKLKNRMRSAVKKVAKEADPNKQAERQIERLAELQSDVNRWSQKREDKVRSIVSEDLRQRLDLGLKVADKIRRNWKPVLVQRLVDAGVNQDTAGILADIVWRQHEINYLNRKMAQVERAVTKGSLAPIIDAIKNTPLAQQQDPEWKRKVAYDYLINAGLDKQTAGRLADLMDATLQKVLAAAQAKAFEDTLKGKLGDQRSRRGMEKFLRAIRTGAIDPSKNLTSEIAAANGWTGFTSEQYARLSELDSIVNDKTKGELELAVAYKEIQDILADAKLQPKVREALSAYYTANALSGIPTTTVNIFSAIGFALRNLMTDTMKNLATNPSALPTTFDTFVSSWKTYFSEVAFSFKNNVQRRGVVEYLSNDDVLLRLYNKGKKQWNQGNRAEGLKNMTVGMMEYVGRLLKALDEGAVSVLEQQGLTRYAMDAMQQAGIPAKDARAAANAVLSKKQAFIEEMVAKGMNKTQAKAMSDDAFRSAWFEALNSLNNQKGLKIPSQEILDAALNDALASVGRINNTMDGLKQENRNIRDLGFASAPPIGLLERLGESLNSDQATETQKVFYRMVYGFAIVPARVFREAAWFSPYGFVRFIVNHYSKKGGGKGRYAQSLGTDAQFRQRLTETIAGTIVLGSLLALAKGSDEDPMDETEFKIVVTGNGPERRLDPQFYDSWQSKYKRNALHFFFGKTKFVINIERGFEAFAIPFMLAGAYDDMKIRKRFEASKATPKDLSDASILLGSAFTAFNRRGPYSAFMDGLIRTQNADDTISALARQALFFGKTFIPFVGTSLARNASDFISDPVDTKSMEGALWSNVPVIGPMIGTKSMNAFGETTGPKDLSSRLYRGGLPLVFDSPSNTQTEKLRDLVISKGQGPDIPTRYDVRRRLGYEPTNKQFEAYVSAYGKYMADTMASNYARLKGQDAKNFVKTLSTYQQTAAFRGEEAAKKIGNPDQP